MLNTCTALRMLVRRVELLEAAARPTPTPAGPEHPAVVVNTTSGCAHRFLGDPGVPDKDTWLTRCGWAFASRPHHHVDQVPARSPKCERCFRDSVGDAGEDSDDFGA